MSETVVPSTGRQGRAGGEGSMRGASRLRRGSDSGEVRVTSCSWRRAEDGPIGTSEGEKE